MRRTTKLNEKEKQYITTNYTELRPSELAVYIGKPEHMVREYINEISPQVKKVFRRDELPEGALPDEFEEVVPCPESLSAHEWELLKRELVPNELKMFTKSYNKLIEQFQGDVLATEEIQVKQAVKLEIFIHRNEQNKKQIVMDLIQIDLQIADEESIPIVSRNDSRLMNLKSQRQSLISTQPALAKEWEAYAERHSKLMGTLRATREQRVKQVADAKTNILGLLKEFQTEKFRKEQSLSMEVNKFALNEEMARLSEPHTYMDGEIDRPILNWETDQDDDNIPLNNEMDDTYADPEENPESTPL